VKKVFHRCYVLTNALEKIRLLVGKRKGFKETLFIANDVKRRPRYYRNLRREMLI